MKLVLATSNAGKVREMASYLADLGFEVVSLAQLGVEQAAETGATFRENAELKAVSAARRTGHWALAEDSGLEVDALGGAPGVFSARYAGESATDEANNRKLLEALHDVEFARRTARFKTVMVLASPEGDVWVSEGTCEGYIATEPRGSGGFGYDPLFWVPELGKCFAELSAEEKGQISHRGRALRAMTQLIKELVAGGALDSRNQMTYD